MVVDGKSTDDSVEIGLSWSVQLIESDKRCRATQMNLGAKKATTDNLYFVHADVIPSKNFISEIVRMDKKGVESTFFRQIFDKMNPFW
ncbi:glycosyltransferase [Crocinitomicaceae bacterium]|nr:glycosyltransferase [Crocinitomicaceae bacterium]